MNGSSSVSPIFTANLCCCGHDLAVHVLATFPTVGACALCNHSHDFTPYAELYPRAEFPHTLPIGCVSPGSTRTLSVGSFTNTTSSPNPKGSVNVTFTNLKQGLSPGMVLLTQPPPGATFAASYRILLVNYGTNTITIAQPGLLWNTNNVPCLWLGADGATSGGGLAPNGQRAG